MSLMYVDACFDLSNERIKTMGVEVVEQPYTLDSENFVTNINSDFQTNDFYKEVKSGKKLNSVTLTEANYKDAFLPALNQGENILYIHYSDFLSHGIKNMEKCAVNLRNEFPNQKIITFDTLGLSVQAGLIAYEGAVLHRRCVEDEEIIETLKDIREQTAFYFMVDNLKNVVGEKVSILQAGNNALIKPIFAVDDNGDIVQVGKAQGKKKALLEMVEKVKELGENLVDYPIAIVHADCEKDALQLKEMLVGLLGSDARIWIEKASPISVAHVGAGAIGVAFHAKKRI